MKQKLFTLLLAVAAGVGTMFASVTINGLNYDLNETKKTAEVANSSCGSGDLVIPSSVTYNSVTYSVTSIGYQAFEFCDGLTSVTIPNSVTSIEDYAFRSCSRLTSVTIPNSVTSIGYLAFDLCYGLTSPVYNAHVFAYLPTSYSGAYTIPDGIESIASGAFYYCKRLTSVTIPNSVTSIGGSAFQNCTGLTSPIYNAHVFAYLPTSYSGAYTIPNGIESIAGSAFSGCSGLTSVTIGNSVTSIGSYAFYNCTGLTSVVWNAKNCSNSGNFGSQVTSFTFGDEVEVIPASICAGMTNLTSITIPSSVTSIGNSAFSGCSGLTSIEIPNSVTSIGDHAFAECTGLTSVTIEADTPPTLDKSVFTSTNNCPIYVPCGTLDTYKAAWSDYTSLITHSPSSACTYSISTASANPEWGTTDGDTIALYLEDVAISAIPNYGYHFVRWNDYNTSNPRTVSVTGDKTYTATFAKNVYSITKNAEHGSISGNSSAEYLDEVTLSANPDYGYHFTQWSDGLKDNPRIFQITKDTTFTAEFAKNTYIISTTSANPEWGTTAGDTAALYLEEVEISAIPNYGYHFVRWNDYNTSNPRTVSVTTDKTFAATFAKNVYSITKNAEHGSISGNSSAEYLDFVTLTVTPDYGYHFTQWSDGNTDNPRIAQITQDTTFTAEVAYDRVGTCGKDLALVWSYDPANKVLTIGNAGSFTENMQYGVEAPNEMEELVIGNSVTAIGTNAFAGIETLKKVSIGESVKTIGEQAFFNCVNLETIFNYRPTPTNTYSNAFDGVDKFECTLYVLPSSIDMYKAAAVWRDFYYTYAIGAEEATVTTNDVTIEPQDNAATVTWPTNDNAATYTIQITKDGVVFCTLIFNANGQLTGIAFAPSRDGQAHAPQALMTAKGMQFTVTGLDSGTHYALTLQAKDDQEAVLASYSSEFTTTGHNAPQGLDEISSSLQGGDRGRLILHDGQILILRGEKVYTVTGQEVK